MHTHTYTNARTQTLTGALRYFPPRAPPAPLSHLDPPIRFERTTSSIGGTTADGRGSEYSAATIIVQSAPLPRTDQTGQTVPTQYGRAAPGRRALFSSPWQEETFARDIQHASALASDALSLGGGRYRAPRTYSMKLGSISSCFVEDAEDVLR